MNDHVLGAERIAEALRGHAGGIAAAVAGTDPDARVPTCPEWTLRDLVGHIGQAHRWAADFIRDGETDLVTQVPRTAPDAPADWPGWLRDGADDLVRAFEADPGRTVAHPVMGPRPAAMWLRRMLHDTAVHHADAAFATGVAYEVAPDVAADGICEWLVLVSEPAAATFRPELAELRGRGETLALRPSEPSVPGWVITRAPDGIAWERASRDGDLTIAGPVRDLMLVFARRLAPGDAEVKVTGDRALLDHWLARTAF
ncbi:maleylpyruvate isomerase family mycothiol-dependent enzyme [Actinomadura opuntiae]|uniref:maleylpyruvate isomerase family mycothiol-dependent enzyme n=1 Tax=Actinomadura sp. OS1-43 TaxID=604315 RepID=UPI00255AD334|nr:maleylpyruvate isomerase family mycothiol-dependent enzyme [Actinomadura sp. OS1-43]MDL4817534.1 maleylpyruvate isomerase family mycothiol-dependent enzyme [Actinomadura sp. OS1-43]